MKTILSLLLSLLFIYSLHAQVLFGTTFLGGTNGGGTITKLNTATNTLSAVFSFDADGAAGANGSLPYNGLVQAGNGRLYGMANRGGSSAEGVLFSFNPATGTYTKLLDFDSTNGAYPYGSLIQASDGKLYGMTTYGGNDNYGVIFSFDPATGTYAKLYDFNTSDGAYPLGSLMQASDGKLYGMTYGGGNDNVGVIFSLDPATGAYAKLYDFDNTNGAYPYGSLVQASDGKLYGMTTYGGNNVNGVIFSFNPANSTYARQFDFDGTNGAYPYGSLVQASDGKLYGMTSLGGNNGNGVLFSFDPANSTYSLLYTFDNDSGTSPYGSLVQASNGKLYGMTSNGGTANAGVSFSFNPATSTYTKLADFTGTNGSNPYLTFFTEAVPQLTISDVSVLEGNSGSKNVSFKVTLSVPTTKTVTVRYKTMDGTATQPSDYANKMGMLNFKPGLSKRYATVRIKGDKQVEGDETFQVMLFNAVNAILEDSIATGTILNDDDMTLAKRSSSTTVSTNRKNVLSITVSPNPASSMVQIQLSGYSGKVMLQITDLTGRVLKKVNLQSSNMKSLQQQFSVAEIPAGTYFIVVADGKGNRQSVKVVVVH